MNPGPRRAVLIGVLVLLGAAVAMDRTGMLDRESSVSQRQIHIELLDQVRSQRALVDRAESIDRARDVLREEWGLVSSMLVSAPTRELAPAAVRDRVRRELVASGVRDPRAIGEDFVGGALSGVGNVESMRVRVTFDAADSDTLYRAIHRLENSTSLLARVSAVSVRAPGLNEAERVLSVTLTIDTAVVLGGTSP